MADEGHGADQEDRVVSAHQVRAVNESVAVGPAPPGSAANAKRVELIRDQNGIRAIEVVCSCGEHIVLHCDYE